MGEYLVPIIIAAATTAVSSGSSMVTSHQQEVKAHQEARKTAAKNRAAWAEMSKPNEEALNAQATQNRGQLAQGRLGSYQNLATNLASRGFGSGSGTGMRGAAGIEKGYLSNLAQSGTELTKFANTSQFAPSSNVYSSPYQASGAGMSSAANPLQQGLGWTMMKNLYGGTQPNYSNSNVWNTNTLDAYNYGPSYTY